jgi:uncharacterized protein YfaS (alpha-2-macroglobulin family)
MTKMIVLGGAQYLIRTKENRVTGEWHARLGIFYASGKTEGEAVERLKNGLGRL